MDISDFKKVELKGNSTSKTIFNSKQLKRTMVFMLIGALGSLAWFYYSEGQHMGEVLPHHIIKSLSIGAFFGLFISNSPCARGQC